MKKYVFSDDDLVKFKELAKLLNETNDFNYSVYEVYGNLKAKREQDFKTSIDNIDDYYFGRLEKIAEKMKNIETSNTLLRKRILDLEHFNSKLEKIEIGLRKTKIGDLLNDKN